jgi:hypothetical protein
MKKYGVTANAMAPLARTRLTVDATPSSAPVLGREVPAGEFDVFSPANVAPLVGWLASDDAAACNGQVFRVGGRTVWPMKGWTSTPAVRNEKAAPWDPAELGKHLKAALAKAVTKGESIADVMSAGPDFPPAERMGAHEVLCKSVRLSYTLQPVAAGGRDSFDFVVGTAHAP